MIGLLLLRVRLMSLVSLLLLSELMLFESMTLTSERMSSLSNQSIESSPRPSYHLHDVD